MRKFTVTYKEVVYKEVTVEADSPDDAEKMVEHGDFNGEYEIDSGEITVTQVEEI
ncbi:hypothetical protein X915_gp081 [Bacillus phage vB_BanS-Tsamsa]|uniref:Phage protein n=1 Tax=Bacillus phage vB_BanS-Tsamsa TaxID=1308863 RepID=U5J9J6_9CAUD|nr:hypothetical protein X915_gp081 [Bacillus phage vB_BanS-Tsamsa]AGI11967.1 hypothetical protein [Bacillus phage vB_BanS-Tsamsa]